MNRPSASVAFAQWPLPLVTGSWNGTRWQWRRRGRLPRTRWRASAEPPPSEWPSLLAQVASYRKGIRASGLAGKMPDGAGVGVEGLKLDPALEQWLCHGAEVMCPVIRYTCQRGHTVSMAAASTLARNSLCPVCQYAQEAARKGMSRRPQLTLARVQEVAAARGGACLSTEYHGARVKLLWRCGKCSHQWHATPDNVLWHRSWCPRCARRRPGESVTLQHMQQLAAERGGACLSEAYLGSQVPLRWRCAAGHEFTATPNNLRRGVRGNGTLRKPSWCPLCARARVGRPRTPALALA